MKKTLIKRALLILWLLLAVAGWVIATEMALLVLIAVQDGDWALMGSGFAALAWFFAAGRLCPRWLRLKNARQLALFAGGFAMVMLAACFATQLLHWEALDYLDFFVGIPTLLAGTIWALPLTLLGVDIPVAGMQALGVLVYTGGFALGHWRAICAVNKKGGKAE